jgi:hypothetical protein
MGRLLIESLFKNLITKGNVMEKKVRKAVQCIKTLLECEGAKLSSNRIMELKEKVRNQMSENTNDKGSTRRSELKAFIMGNWKDIKDNPVVRDALFNSYCMGRIAKEKRNEMVGNLVRECEGEVVEVLAEVVETETETAE